MNVCALERENNTLFSKKIGSILEVVSFGVGLGDKYLRRLLEIGLTHGTRLRILCKSIRGNTLLVEVRGVVFSLEKEITRQIFVR